METTAFPRRPLLDRVIVREIPVEEYFEKNELLNSDLIGRSDVKVRSDRGIVVAVGDLVVMGSVSLPMPVVVGDLVFYDEFCQYDPVYLNPADKYKTDGPKYWQMRVGDLKGIDAEHRNKMVDDFVAQKQAQNLINMPVAGVARA